MTRLSNLTHLTRWRWLTMALIVQACSPGAPKGLGPDGGMDPDSVVRVSVAPRLAQLAPGDTLALVAWAHLQSGDSVVLPEPTYAATGGTITTSGGYIAGANPGVFPVSAIEGDAKADTSRVTILSPAVTLVGLVLSPAGLTLAPGATRQFSVMGTWSDGSSAVTAASYAATGGSITPSGFYTAGGTPGVFRVIATHTGGSPADTVALTVQGTPVIPGRQWTITDDGGFVDVRGAVLHVKFAYKPAGSGWFNGGGGQDGSMVELYYNPTSPTRNLAFRSGLWGGGKEGVDYFATTPASADVVEHSTPKFSSGVDGVLRSHRVWEDAGRLFAEFEFDFKSWRITRTTILYPWGDITIHSHIALITPANWNYLSHSVHFALAPTTITKDGVSYNWGGRYRNDGESFHAWSDMDGGLYTTPYEYAQAISSSVNRNSAIFDFGRNDNYSGFMLDDRNGNDPDIIAMNGDSTTRVSPFQRVAAVAGGNAYVETGIFTPVWANGGTEGATNWFYNTIHCCPAEYSNPMYWPAQPAWDESLNIMLRSNLASEDYMPLWRARAHDLARSGPTATAGATVRLDSLDRMYHVTAAPGASSVQFTWNRGFTAPRAVDYRTAFVIEGLSAAGSATITGANAPAVQAYRDPGTGRVMVLLSGAQPATSVPYTITVGP